MKTAYLVIWIYAYVCMTLSMSIFQEAKIQISIKPSIIPIECPWYYEGGSGRGAPLYGWLVNSTLLTISNYLANKYFNSCGNRIAAYSLWDVIPKHHLILNDPLMMFVHVSDQGKLQSDYFIIVNQTRWPIMGGRNQTECSGVKTQMIVEATEIFVKDYPTGMYLTLPY